MKFKQLDRNVDYNEAASAVGFDNADRYLQELKEKFEIIDRQESKCKLLGTSQYMEFSVVEINKRPCIKLSAVNVNKCLTGDTITVRIPSFVDCIDTTSWLMPELFDEGRNSYMKMLNAMCDDVKHIVIIGNGKPLYGQLDRVSHICLRSTPWTQQVYSRDLVDNQQLETLVFKDFDGRNIQQISSALQDDLKQLRYQNLDEIGLRKLNDISYNNFSVLKSGVSFLENIDLQGCSVVFDTFSGTKEETIDLQRMNLGELSHMQEMFARSPNLRSVKLGNSMKHPKYLEGMNVEKIFLDCVKLEEIPEGFENIAIHDGSCAFSNCKSIKKINQDRLDIQKASIIHGMFSGSGLSGKIVIDGLKFRNAEIVGDEDNKRCRLSNLSWIKDIFSLCCKITQLEIKNIELPELGEANGLFNMCDGLKKVVIQNVTVGHFDSFQKTYNSFWYGSGKMKDMIVDFNGVFRLCKSLEELELRKVRLPFIQLDQAFEDCHNLREIRLVDSEIFGIHSSYRMFYNCSSLNSIESVNSKNHSGEIFASKASIIENVRKYDDFLLNTNLQTIIKYYCKSVGNCGMAFGKSLLKQVEVDPRNLKNFTASLGVQGETIKPEEIAEVFSDLDISVKVKDSGRISHITYVIGGKALEIMKKYRSSRACSTKQNYLSLDLELDNESDSVQISGDIPLDYKLWKVIDILQEVEKIQQNK